MEVIEIISFRSHSQNKRDLTRRIGCLGLLSRTLDRQGSRISTTGELEYKRMEGVEGDSSVKEITK